MFTTVSMTGSGLIALFIATLLGWLGINAETSQIVGWADSILSVFGLILLVWGQLRRKDLDWGFWRK